MKKRFVLCILTVLIPALVGCGLVRRVEAAPPAAVQTAPMDIPTAISSEAPTESAIPEPLLLPTAPTVGTLTAANCPDFSDVLFAQHTNHDLFHSFSQQYDDQVVEFDGCITAIEAHDHDEYQVQVRAGDYNSDGTYSGPTFVLEIENDNHWHHQQSPIFSVGQNVTIQAEIDDFETYHRLFELDYISMVAR